MVLINGPLSHIESLWVDLTDLIPFDGFSPETNPNLSHLLPVTPPDELWRSFDIIYSINKLLPPNPSDVFYLWLIKPNSPIARTKSPLTSPQQHPNGRFNCRISNCCWFPSHLQRPRSPHHDGRQVQTLRISVLCISCLLRMWNHFQCRWLLWFVLWLVHKHPSPNLSASHRLAWNGHWILNDPVLTSRHHERKPQD